MRKLPLNGEFGTIQSALDSARPGDVIRVAEGIYVERVRFISGGQRGLPVTLQGEPGAIIDGREPVQPDWHPAPEIGFGVFRAPLAFFPFTITANGKIVTTLDERRTDPATAPQPTEFMRKLGWKTMLWPDVFREGIPPSGWAGIKAVAMYRHKERDLLIRFEGELDPRNMQITVAPREPAITISGTDRCVVRGLAIRNSATGVLIQNSLGSAVEFCVIGPTDYGIELGRDSEACTIRFNDITMAPYAGADPGRYGAWENWRATKIGGFYDRFGIRIGQTKGRHEIHDNRIHDHWDGIVDHGNPPWEKPSRPKTDNPDLDIHHNYICNLNDDGIETMGPGVDGRWHDNRIERTLCGIRIKAPQVGPLYIYRNVFFENGEDFRNWGEGSQLYPASVFVYHNTSTSDAAISMNYGNMKVPVSTPNYHFYNNLFWCRNWVQKRAADPLPDWQGDHNVFIRKPDSHPSSNHKSSPAGDSQKLWHDGRAHARAAGIDRNSFWVENGNPGFADFAANDVTLTEASPAREKGLDLSIAFRPPLPGCHAGYFSGMAPDAGAYQFGEISVRVPRDPRGLSLSPAGIWP